MDRCLRRDARLESGIGPGRRYRRTRCRLWLLRAWLQAVAGHRQDPRAACAGSAHRCFSRALCARPVRQRRAAGGQVRFGRGLLTPIDDGCSSHDSQHSGSSQTRRRCQRTREGLVERFDRHHRPQDVAQPVRRMRGRKGSATQGSRRCVEGDSDHVRHASQPGRLAHGTGNGRGRSRADRHIGGNRHARFAGGGASAERSHGEPGIRPRAVRQAGDRRRYRRCRRHASRAARLAASVERRRTLGGWHRLVRHVRRRHRHGDVAARGSELSSARICASPTRAA